MSATMTRLPDRAVLAAAAACLWAAGCASTSVYVDRESETGIDNGERIAIVVSRTGQSRTASDDVAVVEERLETCLQPGIRDGAGDVSFIPAIEFHTLSAVRASGVDWSETAKELLSRFKESRAASELASSGIHYLIVVGVRSSTSAPRPEVGGSGPNVAVGASQDTHASVQATILDLKREREAGWIDSYASGVQGGGVGLVGVVPVPFAFFTPFVDSSACSALGQALGKFIAGK